MRLVKATKASPHAKFYSLNTVYTSIVICACLIWADIYVKRQADEGFLTPSETLQS